MKLSKILMTTLAAAAVVGMAGCKSADDDPNSMISGSNSKYTIDYTNESSTAVSRGYKDTAYKHAGAAVQLDFLNVSTTKGAGVMGLIFDLVTTDSSTNKRNFDVVGVRTSNTTGGIQYYVSRFENVTDIQADNFGASTTATGDAAKETEYVKAFATGTGLNADDTTTVYAYAIEKKADEAGTDTAGKAYEANTYVYKVYLLTDKVAKLNSAGDLVDDSGNAVDLSSVTPIATIATGYTKLTQAKLAVYANVYKSSTLKGKWTYRGDYKYCGVDED